MKTGRRKNSLITESGQIAFKKLIETVELNSPFDTLDKIAVAVGLSRVSISNYVGGTRGVPWKTVADIALLKHASANEIDFPKIRTDVEDEMKAVLGDISSITTLPKYLKIRTEELFRRFSFQAEQGTACKRFRLEELNSAIVVLEALLKTRNEETWDFFQLAKVLEMQKKP